MRHFQCATAIGRPRLMRSYVRKVQAASGKSVLPQAEKINRRAAKMQRAASSYPEDGSCCSVEPLQHLDNGAVRILDEVAVLPVLLWVQATLLEHARDGFLVEVFDFDSEVIDRSMRCSGTQ